MNLLKPIKSLIMHLTQSSFQDRVVSFLPTKLATSNPCLLVTDALMEEVYTNVMDKLRSYDGALLVSLSDKLPEHVTEVVIVHSLFDLDLVQRIANAPCITRIIFIAKCADDNGRDLKTLKELESGTDPVTVILAYEEKGIVTTLPRIHNVAEVYSRLINQE